MEIRQSRDSDRAIIDNIHRKAFGEQEGPQIVELVNGLLDDHTASPVLSLVAIEAGKIIGHILFTKVIICQAGDPVAAQILAPLAVLPNSQRKGVGGELIQEGVRQLQQAAVQLVFVLGHPDYYPRFGFTPAGDLGYKTPYPIPEEHAEAWMVLELCPGVIGRVKGKVQCSKVLNKPEYWQE